MPGIENWSTTPADNSDTPPNGWPESTMTVNQINDTGRQGMADVRSWYEDQGWANMGDTHVYASALTTTIATDETAVYLAGRAVRAVGSATGTIYGTVVSSSYSAPNTTVTYKWDGASAGLSNEALTISLGFLGPTNALPRDMKRAVNHAKAEAVASAATTDIWAANGNLVHVTGSTGPITSFGTAQQAGSSRLVIFDSTPTITRDGTAIEIQGMASWTPSAGDAAWVYADTTTKALVYPLPIADRIVKQSFSAHKNATNQTGVTTATEVKVTFGTEVFDVGAAYDVATSRWTPAAGKVLINAAILIIAGTVDQQITYIGVYKNGALFRRGGHFQQNGVSVGPMVTIIDDANGTDYYEIYAYAEGAGDKTISGVANVTYFMGSHL